VNAENGDVTVLDLRLSLAEAADVNTLRRSFTALVPGAVSIRTRQMFVDMRKIFLDSRAAEQGVRGSQAC
jgi:hypothetical protein